jgi:hypothetical protein
MVEELEISAIISKARGKKFKWQNRWHMRLKPVDPNASHCKASKENLIQETLKSYKK